MKADYIRTGEHLMNIDLSTLPRLSAGSHFDLEEGACVMEAVSFVAGEPWSDSPACVCPVIGAFMRVWNDGLHDEERDSMLRPLITRLVGTGSEILERRRSLMAADWLIRVQMPALLRLANLDAPAGALASLPEITDLSQCPSLMPAIEAARSAVAAKVAGWDASFVLGLDCGWAAARAAARDGAWDVAWSVVWAASHVAPRDALKAAAPGLQKSALRLVERMIEARDE